MTFATILKAVLDEYHFTCCYVADNMHLEDEIVEDWLEGKSYPNDEQLKKFSEMFAIPYNTLKKSTKEEEK